MKCQECDSTDDVKRRFKNRKKWACWNCRKEEVFRRAAQGGADRRPVTGEYKGDFKNETVNTEESIGKEGEGGQATFGDF